jgi:alpha-mannosidase
VPLEVLGHHGKPVPFQLAPTEHQFLPNFPWRKRFVVAATLPALGYQVIHVAWNETPRLAPVPLSKVRSKGATFIANEAITVRAKAGDEGVAITLDGKALFGRTGLHAITFEDRQGSWGNHDNEPGGDNLSKVIAQWRVTRTEVLERGPLRAVLWVMLESGASRLELTFTVEAGMRYLRVAARLLWNERSARLKLIMPGAGAAARFEVPGGEVERGELGEVPGGRWVRADSARVPFVFASDALYNFDLKAGDLRATVVRSTRYARNASSGPEDEPWRAHLDLGEHRFQFALGAADVDAWELADRLEQPTQALLTAPHEGPRGREGSLLRLSRGTRLLALKPALDGKGWILRAQGSGKRESAVSLEWMGARIALGRITPFEIISWRLTCLRSDWIARRVNTAEERLASR